MTVAPEQLPVIVARLALYNDLHRAVRQRVLDLGFTRDGLDEAMKTFPDGYASKLLSAVPSRRLGLNSVFPVLDALGFDLVLVNNPCKFERAREVAARNRKRVPYKVVLEPVKHELADSPERRGLQRLVLRQRLSKLGKKGGRKGGPARAKSLTPKQRSKIAKTAANARWKRPKLTELPHDQAAAIIRDQQSTAQKPAPHMENQSGALTRAQRMPPSRARSLTPSTRSEPALQAGDARTSKERKRDAAGSNKDRTR